MEEEVLPHGKEEKDVFAPPTPSSNVLPLLLFLQSPPKTKRMVPALALHQHNPTPPTPPTPVFLFLHAEKEKGPHSAVEPSISNLTVQSTLKKHTKDFTC